MICSPSDTSCTVICNAEYACSGEIHCPSTSSCSSCVIDCDGEYACANSTLYSHDCRNVDVFTARSYGLAYSTMIAPGNGGELDILIISASYGLYLSTLIAVEDTYEIDLTCSDSSYVDVNGTFKPNAKNECINNTIDATKSDYLSWQCQSDTKCANTIVYCPKNYNGYFINSCSVSHSDNIVYNNIYYAANGIPIVKLQTKTTLKQPTTKQNKQNKQTSKT